MHNTTLACLCLAIPLATKKLARQAGRHPLAIVLPYVALRQDQSHSLVISTNIISTRIIFSAHSHGVINTSIISTAIICSAHSNGGISTRISFTRCATIRF